jgi:hypothetical protein
VCALGCALALLGSPAMAQEKAGAERTSAEWLALIQADKKAIVAKSMDLTADEAAKFWPLYETFQRELAVPQNAVTRALLDYIAAGHTLTDANAKRIVEETLVARKEEARLREKHFRQLLKVLPAHKAARYMQIENKIQAVVAYEGAKAVPLAR